MNPSKNYIALLENRMSRAEFLRQARQAFPNLIGAGNTFDDALKILTRRGLINEELVYQNKADKFSLEAIERGIRYELEAMDVYDIHHPSQEQYKKARQRTIDNLCKNPLYYIDKIAKETEQPSQEETEGDLKKVTPSKKNLQEGRYTEDQPLKEKKALTMRPDEGHGRNHVAPERNFEKKNPAGEKYESDPEMQTADKLFVALMAKSNSNQATLKTMANGAERTRTPDECLKMVQRKFPKYKRPFKHTMRNLGLTWFRKQDGTTRLEFKSIHEAQYEEISKDPVYTQFYQHYLKKAKDANDVNAEKTARGQAKKAYMRYQEKHAMKEQNKKLEEMVLKESVIQIIGQILKEGMLEEAATTNLAALSDENASVSELPAAINSLENIVTEIESFWLKEQQKIQGVFDSLGNIKNEDGLPIGYKFAQPILESFKKDLAPVLEKISLDNLNLPEAPAPDQTQVNDPNAELDPNDPNAVPPVPEKKTVFSPAEKEEPLQESKKNKRYTK